jgi:hypothetical protein
MKKPNMYEYLKRQKGMLLLPPEIEAGIPPPYSQEEVKDPMCVVKFFALGSNWTWYVIEYNPKDRICYGYVIGHEAELGYFSMDELESLGALIERDIYFTPAPLSEIKKKSN